METEKLDEKGASGLRPKRSAWKQYKGWQLISYGVYGWLALTPKDPF